MYGFLPINIKSHLRSVPWHRDDLLHDFQLRNFVCAHLEKRLWNLILKW